MRGGGASPRRSAPRSRPLPPGGDRDLLPPLAREDIGKKCLVLDLDETLVHSSFQVSAAAAAWDLVGGCRPRRYRPALPLR